MPRPSKPSLAAPPRPGAPPPTSRVPCVVAAPPPFVSSPLHPFAPPLLLPSRLPVWPLLPAPVPGRALAAALVVHLLLGTLPALISVGRATLCARSLPARVGAAFRLSWPLLACLDAFTSSCAGAGCAVAFLAVPSLAGCCFPLFSPLFAAFPGQWLCCVPLKVVLMYRFMRPLPPYRVLPPARPSMPVFSGVAPRRPPLSCPSLRPIGQPVRCCASSTHHSLHRYRLNRLEGSAPAR